MLFVYVTVLCITLSHIACAALNSSQSSSHHYLSKPTGPYGVGFEDFHWINQNICPDFIFNGKNPDDFSSDNSKHCHEIVARVYYPTVQRNQTGALYYQPIQQELISDIHHDITPEQSQQLIQQLSKLKSYSVKNALIVTEKTFPVIFLVLAMVLQLSCMKTLSLI
jgi:hypothetical protein